MSFRYPNIIGKTPMEQIAQLRSFLYQLVEELNLQQNSGIAVVEQQGASGAATQKSSTQTGEQNSPLGTFNQIKNLIIKSADIVDAYETEITKRLEGKYVAESDFGTYTEETAKLIEENSKGLTTHFDSIQKLEAEMKTLIGTNAYVRQGLLFKVGEDGELEEELGQTDLGVGTPVYGVEVGQSVTVDGEQIFRKFARFTAYGMCLYDSGGQLSAYITDKRLHIPNCVITVSLTRGGFQETIDSERGSVERWVG